MRRCLRGAEEQCLGSLVECRGFRMTLKGTHKATAQALKELWAKFANESLERTGDEGRAIRQANAVVARRAEAGH